MTKFKVGDRVGEMTYDYDPSEDNFCGGTIINVNYDKGIVTVKWDESWRGEVVCPAEDLVSEEKAKNKFSEIEKTYNTYAEQVREKLKEAGKLLKEANKLTKKAGRGSLSKMYEEHDELYNAMDSCGWQTSSFGC